VKKSILPKRDTKIKRAQKRSSTNVWEKRELFPVVGIGASAGGLEAFSSILAHLPEKTGMAFVFVQHLDPHHESTLGEILSRATKIRVTEASEGMEVERNHIYVIPSNKELIIKDGRLRLSPRRAVGPHRTVDRFFKSLAEDCGGRAIGVVLSGTASDGTAGCRMIKAAGGITFAQDPTTAKYDGMPRSAVEEGCIDFVRPPQGIAEELASIGAHPYLKKAPIAAGEGPLESEADGELEKLFEILRTAKGVDFGKYKQRTVQRGIRRRMVLNRVEKLADYTRFVKSNSAELDELYRDILIHRTGFFRDAGAFELLRTQIFPEILEKHRQDRTPIRIWVPGCSTGEEAYSMAIAISEYIWDNAAKSGKPGALTPVQIFATDISDEALERARAGVYPESALTEVPAATLQKFFVRLEGGYHIGKYIREVCVFARQNIVRDPPFSRLDLISCRNVLIYLGPEMQRRVVPALYYGLNPKGYLLLGSSENIGVFSDHFELVDKEIKLYRRKAHGRRLISYFTNVHWTRTTEAEKAPRRGTGTPVERELDRVIASRFAPASMLVNSEMEIVHLRGNAGAYLELPSGRPSLALPRLAREDLLAELCSALQDAQKKNEAVRREGVEIRSNGKTREVDLEIIPIQGEETKEKLFVIVFQERPEKQAGRTGRKPPRERISGKEMTVVHENRQLMREVNRLRHQMNMLVEDHETTAEEFRTANEEVLSANEELQSTNEELETAKEELQSNNEELTTLNEELKLRNTELVTTNNDLLNLIGNVNIPMVMVGDDLRIRRFTPSSQKLLALMPTDIGRRLGEIHPKIGTDDLEELVRHTVSEGSVHEREVRDASGAWYLMRIRPYKTWDQQIEGAVISFQDIDILKRALEKTRAYADALIENAREAILLLNEESRVVVANHAFYSSFRVAPEETEGQLIYELGNGQWNIPELRELLERVAKENVRVDDFAVRHDFPRLGNRVMLVNARRIEPKEGQPLIFVSIEDVSGQGWRAGPLRQGRPVPKGEVGENVFGNRSAASGHARK
jgi:two-component system, chemotaxis family, CheB/CheR fusion protein